MDHIAYSRVAPGAALRRADRFTDVTVVDDRVLGTEQWDNGEGSSRFNVKLQPGLRFFKGSGSGKIIYHLRKAVAK